MKDELNVVVNGKRLKKYFHEDKWFIAATKDTEYSVEIKNPTSSRKLVVLSIDGINAVSGKPAANSTAGYVVAAYDKVEIKGYRIDNDNVANFKFTSNDGSYSKEVIGSSKNNGVIGIQVYNEKEKPVPATKIEYVPVPYSVPYYPRPYRRGWFDDQPYWGISDNTVWNSNNSVNFCSSFADGGEVKGSGSDVKMSAAGGQSVNMMNLSASSTGGRGLTRSVKSKGLMGHPDSGEVECGFSLGSTWGGKQEHKVKEVDFEVGTLYVETVIYYAPRKALEAMGVKFEKETQKIVLPQAFESKFCTPPKNWKSTE